MKIDDIVRLERREILGILKFDNIKEIIEEIKPKPCIIYSKKVNQIFPQIVKKYGLVLISERGETISFENNKIHLIVNFNRYTKKFLGYSNLIKETRNIYYYKNYRG